MQRKKRRSKLKKIPIIILLIVLILFVVLIKLPKKETKEIVPEEPEIKEYKLSLIMAGDALIHDRLYNDANRQANYDGYDFKPYLKLIKEKVSNYDLAYYNQETILGGTSIGLSTYPAFNSPQELGDALIDAGFNMVSLATNHTLDRGETAVLLSREYWNKQENVYAFGSYSFYDEKKELESQVFEKNNIKYGILNYTYGTNGIPVPYGKDYLVNLWPDLVDNESYKATVINDINNLRSKVDVLIVAMHWGIEYTHTPTDLVKRTAKFLADNKVDIVIGTHPHVIEPVEWIDNTIVFYSLGNFISAQNSESCVNYKCNIGLLSSLEITKTIDGDIETIKIDNIENDLIYTYHNNNTNYLVIPFSNKIIKDYLNDYENVYNSYASIIASDDERIKTLPLGNWKEM